MFFKIKYNLFIKKESVIYIFVANNFYNLRYLSFTLLILLIFSCEEEKIEEVIPEVKCYITNYQSFWVSVNLENYNKDFIYNENNQIIKTVESSRVLQKSVDKSNRIIVDTILTTITFVPKYDTLGRINVGYYEYTHNLDLKENYLDTVKYEYIDKNKYPSKIGDIEYSYDDKGRVIKKYEMYVTNFTFESISEYKYDLSKYSIEESTYTTFEGKESDKMYKYYSLDNNHHPLSNIYALNYEAGYPNNILTIYGNSKNITSDNEFKYNDYNYPTLEENYIYEGLGTKTKKYSKYYKYLCK